MKAEDILGIGKAANTLIESLTDPIKRLFRNHYLKRDSSSAINMMNNANDMLSSKGEVNIEYSDPSFKISFTNKVKNSVSNEFSQDLLKATLIELINKEQTVIQIIAKAVSELNQNVEQIGYPLQNDWLNIYSDFAKNITDESVQEIWVKVLANEVLRPKSFSLRTLSVLRLLNKEEAQLFSKIAKYVLLNKEKDVAVLLDDIPFYTKEELIILNDCGLLKFEHFVQTINFESEYVHFDIAGKNIIYLDKRVQGTILTNAGKELLSLIERKSSNELLELLFKNPKFSYKL